MDGPKVGVGVFVRKNGKFLVGKRKGSHGEGCWALPGGHIEAGESLEEACSREVFEETNLRIKNIQKLTFRNAIFQKEQKHYITLFFSSECDSGRLKIMESNKCDEWRYCSLLDVPEPRFGTLSSVLNSIKENFM